MVSVHNQWQRRAWDALQTNLFAGKLAVCPVLLGPGQFTGHEQELWLIHEEASTATSVTRVSDVDADVLQAARHLSVSNAAGRSTMALQVVGSCDMIFSSLSAQQHTKRRHQIH